MLLRLRLLTRLASVLIGLLPLALSAADPAARRPNFLFVFTDDQRWDAMGVVQREQGAQARFPWFQTPAMDRMATEGVRFRNAFVVHSLCAPSRAAFLTGRYNHVNGIANNRTPFGADTVTHATLLRAAGYTTGYVGKWHMGQQRGQRPGFDYSASFIGQGRYRDCPIEINGRETPTQGWIDDVSTDYAIAFLREHRTQPFSLVVGFKACHGPFDPPERAKDRFAGALARRVPNYGLRAIYRDAASDAPPAKTAGSDTKPEVPVNLDYFRCISAADDNLGRLLQALDELGLADDTVVVFSSDNGYYLGEHNLGDKRSAYEESLRIPMLIRYPRALPKGAVRDELVLNIDLAPTWVDFAGLGIPSAMQGRSWKPLLTTTGTAWRNSFLAEYFAEAAYPQTPTLVALRTTQAKLIRYPGHEDWTEVFDLASDPYETRNLARDPARQALRASLEAEFEAQVKATGFVIPGYADSPAELAAGKQKQPKKKAGKENKE
jgi:arylsulfatase A-like enzyme